MQEIVGEAAVERFFQVGSECVSAPSLRGTAVFAGMTVDDLIEPLAVGRHHILHVGDILQPPLNLHRAGTGLHQFLQRVNAAHILQRQQMTALLYRTAVGILQVELQPAELRAGTPVGTTMEAIFRRIANARITDAQSSVNKHFQLHIGHRLVNRANILHRQLTCQHHSAKAQRAQPLHFFHRPIVGLCGGMHAERRMENGELRTSIGRKPGATDRKNAHVLHEDGIHAGVGQAVDQLLRSLHLIVVDNGVDRYIHLGPKPMGITAQLTNIVHRIAGSHTGTEALCSDVDGIGSMLDGSYAAFQILGRGQQFNGLHLFGMLKITI